MKYRADIDALRGIAVIAVLLFHAGLPLFQGGFVGVDVFFVISGFLITSLVRKDAASGLFSVTRFFSRRIRRIFPALFVVVAFSTAGGFWLLPPNDFANFGTSQIYTALFAANIHFWRLSLNYFAEGRPYPLLHAWSLGVEEQFYIAVPFAFLFITRQAPGRLRAAAITAFYISLGAFLIGMPDARTTAFYLAPFRAWEFLAGAILAGGLLPSPSERFRPGMLSLAGVLLILASIVGQANAPVASVLRVLAAVVGTTLVIWAGLKEPPLANRCLATGVLPKIGLVSYSLYLWHWPLLVFASALAARPLSSQESLFVLAGTLPLSYLSWRFVELPFRSYPEPGSPDSAFRAAGLVTIITLASGLYIRTAKGVPDRFSAQTLALIEDSGSRLRLSDLAQAQELDFPRLGDVSQVAPTLLVWGDSHAASAAPAFEFLVRKHGRAGILASYSACPPIIEERGFLNDLFPGFPCPDFNAAVLRLLRKEHFEDVVLAAHWFGHRTTEEGFKVGLEATIREVNSVGARLWVLEETPGTPFHPQIRAIRLERWDDFATWFSFPRPQHDLRALELRRTLSQLPPDIEIHRLDPTPQFCDDSVCRTADKTQLLYRDRHHLNRTGALRLVPVLEPIFAAR